MKNLILGLLLALSCLAVNAQCIDTSGIPDPCICISIFDPVIGCDCVQYSNSCEANSCNGVQTWAGAADGWFPGDPCPFTQSCIDPALITPICPCPFILDPVCGCNGMEYDNDCIAQCDGVTSWIGAADGWFPGMPCQGTVDCTTLDLVVSVTCDPGGMASGTLTFTTTGGTAPYTFTGDQDGDILADGAAYDVTVTDDNGCMFNVMGTVNCPTNPCATSTLSLMVDFFCDPGGLTGTLSVTPSGGTPPYTFTGGNDGDVVNDGDMLDVEVIDDDGCSVIQSVTIVCPATPDGCTDPAACNFDPAAANDDGTCLFVNDPCDDGDPLTSGDIIDPGCNCTGVSIGVGCTDVAACNFDPSATIDDGSCLIIGDPCDDGDPITSNDAIDSTCACVGDNVAPVYDLNLTDPCNCFAGVDLNGDGDNDLAQETFTIMQGAGGPYTSVPVGLVDNAGNPLTAADVDALIAAADPGTGADFSFTAYVVADGLTIYTLDVTDSAGLTASIQGGPCTQCSLEGIPTASEWGLLCLALSLLSILTIYVRRRELEWIVS